jgi:alkyl hydroperoxide reductase subunit AhpC
MLEASPTYELAAEMVAAHVQPLETGALPARFSIRDEDGRMLSLEDDHLSGKPMILAFLNTDDDEICLAALKALAGRQLDLAQRSTTVIAVSANTDADRAWRLKHEAGFFWSVTGDCSGAVFANYGLHMTHGEAVRLVLLTPLRQVRSWFDSPSNIDETLDTIMTQIDSMQSHEDERWFPVHAPILMIPNVLSRDECQALIHSFETGGPFIVHDAQKRQAQGDYKMPIYEHDRQDRVDHMIKDPKTMEFLTERIGTRINPMIKKAFAFDVDRREDIHIARYTGKRGGVKMGHRDNTSPHTAYRRFALSMNLNDDFEGGEVVFKEFNAHGYKGEPGTALIFSSSLLHEIQETTSGVRYSLISHLFNSSTIAKR